VILDGSSRTHSWTARGERPPISAEDQLARGPQADSVTQLVEEFAAAWERGERPAAEVFLDRHPGLNSQPEAAIRLIYIDVLARVQQPSPWPQSRESPTLRFIAQTSYVRAVCWIVACLADALHYAHDRGLVHMDVKPSNILLTADGQPMLLDFHLAREPIPKGTAPAEGVGGTPGYMSPEQAAVIKAIDTGEPIPL
jgi:hypothetical protein